MRRRRHEEDHENHERWLVSYADFITLLFAFFVVMYSISSVNEGKFRVLSEALVASFRAPARSMEPIQVGRLARTSESPAVPRLALEEPLALPPVPIPYRQRQPRAGVAERAAGMAELSRRIEDAMGPLIDRGMIEVRRSDDWVEVEIRTSILFPSGSARLSPDAEPVLRELARLLAPLDNQINVEGFTDNVPIRTAAYPSNWELSAARAASVVHLFVDAGVDPLRLAAIGYGEYHPVADNSTPEGRSRNRRVVLVIQAPGDRRAAGASTTSPSGDGPGAAG